MADSEGTWQIGTDSAATIAASDFGQWSPTHANPDLDLWASADAALMPVAQRALKRAVTQLAEIADGTRSVLAIDVTGTVRAASTTLEENAAIPGGNPTSGTGKLWLRDDGVLMFTNDTPTAHELTGAGAAATLANVLIAGNTTGARNIEITNGQAIVGDDAGSISFAATTGLITTTAMSVGDPGAESDGIVLGGVAYDGQLKSAVFGGAQTFSLILDRHSTSLPPLIVFARSRSSDSTHTIVSDGDGLLGLYAAGWDGVDYALGGSLAFEVDGTPGAGDMPARFVLALSQDGTESPSERFKILSDGTATLTGDLTVTRTVTVTETLTVTGKNYSVVRGSTARGSTNTRIYRWTAEVDSAGTDITYSDSATDGGSWQVTTAGIYSVSVSQEAGAATQIAIKAAAALSNTFDETSIKAVVSASVGTMQTMHWTGPLAANDRIWISVAATSDPSGSSANYRTVTVTRIH